MVTSKGKLWIRPSLLIQCNNQATCRKLFFKSFSFFFFQVDLQSRFLKKYEHKLPCRSFCMLALWCLVVWFAIHPERRAPILLEVLRGIVLPQLRRVQEAHWNRIKGLFTNLRNNWGEKYDRSIVVWMLQDLSYKDKHWHEKCFFCSQCKSALIDKPFGSKNDHLYCGDCYNHNFASRCDRCGQTFKAGKLVWFQCSRLFRFDLLTMAVDKRHEENGIQRTTISRKLFQLFALQQRHWHTQLYPTRWQSLLCWLLWRSVCNQVHTMCESELFIYPHCWMSLIGTLMATSCQGYLTRWRHIQKPTVPSWMLHMLQLPRIVGRFEIHIQRRSSILLGLLRPTLCQEVLRLCSTNHR